jgi:hypothetical protein
MGGLLSSASRLLDSSKKTPERAGHRADDGQEAGDHHPDKPGEVAFHGIESAVHTLEPAIHLVSKVPHFFPEFAEVLSKVGIPFPDLGQLGSVLLTPDFQQRDPLFKVRHVSPP